MVKNPPANAGDRFYPWPGKIPHAMGQLSPCTAATEPLLQSLSAAENSSPRSLQLESALPCCNQRKLSCNSGELA